jgi:hypothetical protein
LENAMALGTDSGKKKPASEPAKTSAKKATARKAIHETAAEVKPAKGLTRVYPTHRRQAGDLIVALPAVLDDDGNVHSGELVITDKGADIEDELADQLIAAREVTTKSEGEG